MRTRKLLKATDKEQPVLLPMRSLGMCGEIFDSMAEIVEDDTEFAYNMKMIAITLSDGWVMPIVIILN